MSQGRILRHWNSPTCKQSSSANIQPWSYLLAHCSQGDGAWKAHAPEWRFSGLISGVCKVPTSGIRRGEREKKEEKAKERLGGNHCWTGRLNIWSRWILRLAAQLQWYWWKIAFLTPNFLPFLTTSLNSVVFSGLVFDNLYVEVWFFWFVMFCFSAPAYYSAHSCKGTLLYRLPPQI